MWSTALGGLRAWHRHLAAQVALPAAEHTSVAGSPSGRHA